MVKYRGTIIWDIRNRFLGIINRSRISNIEKTNKNENHVTGNVIQSTSSLFTGGGGGGMQTPEVGHEVFISLLFTRNK